MFDLIDNWFLNELDLIFRKSIISRLNVFYRMRARSLFIDNLLDRLQDNVMLLENIPLGMFIYNLRAIFMVSSGAFLLVLSIISWLVGWLESVNVVNSLGLLWLGLILVVSLTLYFHSNFISLLAKDKNFSSVVSVFRKYFWLDAIVAFLMVVGGFYFGIYIPTLLFLILSNRFVSSTFNSSETKLPTNQFSITRNFLPHFSVMMFVLLWFVIHFPAEASDPVPRLYFTIIYWFPVIASILISLLSTNIITHLRKKEFLEAELVQARLTKILTEIGSFKPENTDTYMPQLFGGLNVLLKEICAPASNYSYSRIWLKSNVNRINHANLRNENQLFLAAEHIISKSQPIKKPDFRGIEDSKSLVFFRRAGKTILIPIIRNKSNIGYLELGRKHQLFINQIEEKFIRTIVQLVSFSIQLFSVTDEYIALEEIDSILGDFSLIEVYENAIKILQTHLGAKGIMLLILEKKTGKLELVQCNGFDTSQLKSFSYSLGTSLTGKCASEGKIIRINEMDTHLDEFNLKMLDRIEKALGEKVQNWMAIPIGIGEEVLGVVKVINKISKYGAGFTDYDQKIADVLAQKLKILLRGSIQMEESRNAKAEALESAEQAKNTAADRQQDLVSLSHQLQGPLSISIGKISYILEEENLRSWLRNQLEYANAILKDALDIMFGIMVATGSDVGIDPYLSTKLINVSEETKSLYDRIKRTNNRRDLKITYEESVNFPDIKIDKKVFRTVMYTLLHNAIKYADRGSRVDIECGFEHHGPTEVPAIKVKSIGPIIASNEREKIFERFYRGRAVRYTGIYGEPSIGLGLWIARKLIRLSGGDLKIEVSQLNASLSIFVIYGPETRGIKNE